MEQSNAYIKGFIPYALAAFLIGIAAVFFLPRIRNKGEAK